MRSKTGYAEFGYFHCYLKMDAPRALVFRPLVRGNEALGTRLGPRKSGTSLNSSFSAHEQSLGDTIERFAFFHSKNGCL